MTKPLFMARLAGTQQEMGAQHGRLVGGDARELVEFYRTMPERSLVGAVDGVAGRVARTVVRGIATAWQANLARTRPADLAGHRAPRVRPTSCNRKGRSASRPSRGWRPLRASGGCR